MKNVSKIFFLGLFLIVSACSKESAAPDPTANLTDKWWCDSANKLAAQYFKADGNWEQGSKTGGANNDKGKWKLSTDKKKILITDVVGKAQTLKNWEYEIISSSATNLDMNYAAFNIKMNMIICK